MMKKASSQATLRLPHDGEKGVPEPPVKEGVEDGVDGGVEPQQPEADFEQYRVYARGTHGGNERQNLIRQPAQREDEHQDEQGPSSFSIPVEVTAVSDLSLLWGLTALSLLLLLLLVLLLMVVVLLLLLLLLLLCCVSSSLVVWSATRSFWVRIARSSRLLC